jgi:beta-glucosidase/6-phospho-beta-glucosidase/beta-galactosidase
MFRNMQNDLVLKSFFMGGFECADHINRSGARINLLKETLHHTKVLEDYKALHKLGINVVREGVCWSAVEIAPFEYDFNALKGFIDAAKALDIQIIWDLCHFGYPDGLYPTHPHFPDRFVSFCERFTIFYYEYCSVEPWIVPINEISFLSWHSGDMRGTVPFAVNSGWDIKYHLCKAAILGIKAIRAILNNTVILAVEPLVKVHPEDIDSDVMEVERINNFQFQAMDIILGRECPELGGEESLIDMLGFNYYYNNQWTQNNEVLPWPNLDTAMTPLSELLLTVQRRYNFPLLLTETGHFGLLRALWLNEVISECIKAIEMGVDLRGVCIYPVIDRPDWDDLTSYSNCGFWDLDSQGNRVACVPYIQELLIGQKILKDSFQYV